MLRYFLNSDLIGEVLPVIRKMLKDKMSMVRRKSLLVIYNIYQIQPLSVTDIKQVTIDALNDPDVPVIFGALSILKNLIPFDPVSFKPYAGKLLEVFEKLLDHKFPPEYDYHKIPAPWMQIDLLFML